MKRFLSLTVALAMAVSLVPATAFAKSDLKVDKTVTAEVGDYLYDGSKINNDTSRTAPQITLKADGNFNSEDQQFRLKLTNAEWLSEDDGEIADLNKGGKKADKVYIQDKNGNKTYVNGSTTPPTPDDDLAKKEEAARKALQDKLDEFASASSSSAATLPSDFSSKIEELANTELNGTGTALTAGKAQTAAANATSITDPYSSQTNTWVKEIYAQLPGKVQDALNAVKADGSIADSQLNTDFAAIASAMGTIDRADASKSLGYMKAVQDLKIAKDSEADAIKKAEDDLKKAIIAYNDAAAIDATIGEALMGDEETNFKTIVAEFADGDTFEAKYAVGDFAASKTNAGLYTAVTKAIGAYNSAEGAVAAAEKAAKAELNKVKKTIDAFNTTASKGGSTAADKLKAEDVVAEYDKGSTTGFRSYLIGHKFTADQADTVTDLTKTYSDAKKANVKKAAIITTPGTVTFERMTDSILIVTVDGIQLQDDDELVFPLYTYLNGGTATVEVDPRESEFSSDSKTFAKTAEGSTKSYSDGTKNFNDGDELKTFFVEEITPGTFEAGKKVTVKLTSGFKWKEQNNKGRIYFKEGKHTFPTSDLSYDLDDNELTFTMPSGRSTEATTLVFEKFSVKEDGANFNTECKITISGAGISKDSFVVGTYTDYTVSLKAEDKTLPVIYSGSYVQDNEDDNEALKVYFEELVDNAWLIQRKTTFSLPEGVKFADVEVKKADKVEGGTSALEDLLRSNIDGNEITLNSDDVKRIGNKSKIKTEIIFYLSVDPAFTGDIDLTVTGAGVANEDLTTTIATAKAPFTVKADANEVKIDYRNVEVGDITITEPEAGLWEKGQYIALEVEEMQFEGGIKAEVVSGDMTLEKLDGDNVKVVKKDGTVIIQVKTTSSSTPAEIKLSGIKLYLNRSLPAGDYELQAVVYNGAGKDFGKGEDNSDVMFANYYDNDANDKVGTIGFDTDSVTLLTDFVKVVTAGRDQDDATFTTKITVPVGSDTITAGNKSIKVDSPAYINNDGYTMLPVRAVTEALNGIAVVRWDDPTKTATVSFGQRVFSMTVGSKQMNMNGVSTGLLAAPEIKNERIFLPLRDLGYALGLSDAKINWDSATSTATLN